ncbi:ABC1-domain-containing protein [Ascobolus immersus RN42]|uniref:ABC1-domain-containing protein n=1 Tax=Ascobolus immersus RN42 TaxID=1160509 RepID=A0A3N4I1P6_ASCIM|nr:ABC1-domain-containing protein [Ascobolus immersus RN42]
MSLLLPRLARHGTSQAARLSKLPSTLSHIRPNTYSLLGPTRNRCLTSTPLRHYTSRSRIPPTGPTNRHGKALISLAAFTLAGALLPVIHADSPPKKPEVAGLQGEMLSVSDQERADARKPPERPWWERILGELALAFTDWVIEPIATTFRFIHLFTIFVPVIISVPAVWIGKRNRNRSNERSGTLWWYGFLVHSMERAGPTFIKLGQWAASRADIFPAELCERLSKLHSNAKPHSFHTTVKTVEAAFGGMKFDDIFEEFDTKPLGVGAIAQVYRAKLKPGLQPPRAEVEMKDFRERLMENVDSLVKYTPATSATTPSSWVAVKVLHPHVDRTVNRDLKIMAFFAKTIDMIPTMEWLSLPDEVRLFGEMMRLQLDLRIEATNLGAFRRNFRTRPTVAFPLPYSDYSTRDVLIEEFAHGLPLGVFLEQGGGAFQKDIANMGLDAFLKMLLLDNFIHADLHPGNIMVRFYPTATLSMPSISSGLSMFSNTHEKEPEPPTDLDITTAALQRLLPLTKDPVAWTEELNKLEAEGYRPQLIFIDAGLVTELSPLNRRNFIDLFRAIAEFDGPRAGRLMIERSRQPESVLEGDVFVLKMQDLILSVKERTFALGKVKIGDLLNTVLGMVRGHHVRLEGDFVNVVISILLLEGIGRSLNPDMDLFKSALPMLRQLGTGGMVAGMRGEKGGDLEGMDGGDLWSFVKVWVGLELREYLVGSAEMVETCVKYDLLAPNI